MGVGVSILLIAAGAILTWAARADVSGISIQTVGVILLIVGIIGLVAVADLLVVVGRPRLTELVGARTSTMFRRVTRDDSSRRGRAVTAAPPSALRS